jgi:chromosomal replication initiation ATPase DnaA
MGFYEVYNYDVDLIAGFGFRKTMKHVCRRLGVRKKDILSKSRERDIVEARHLFWYFAKKWTDSPISLIARYSNCTHSTVIHGIKNVRNIAELDLKRKMIENDRKERPDNLHRNGSAVGRLADMAL